MKQTLNPPFWWVVSDNFFNLVAQSPVKVDRSQSVFYFVPQENTVKQARLRRGVFTINPKKSIFKANFPKNLLL